MKRQATGNRQQATERFRFDWLPLVAKVVPPPDSSNLYQKQICENSLKEHGKGEILGIPSTSSSLAAKRDRSDVAQDDRV